MNDYDRFEKLFTEVGLTPECEEIGEAYHERFPNAKRPLSMIKFKPEKVRDERGRIIGEVHPKIFGYSDSTVEFIFDQEGVFLGVGVWEE